MRIWSWLVVAACWTGPVTPPPEVPSTPHHIDAAPRSEFDDILLRFESIVDQMCECHDQSCADRLTEDLSAWANEMTQHRDIKPSSAELDRMSALSQRYAQCVNNAMGAPPGP